MTDPVKNQVHQIRVLLVDDEPAFRTAMAKRLNKRGFDVSEASDSLECMALLGRQEIDVVVMDVKMPGPDGIETLKTIRGKDFGCQVILLTGNAAVTDGIEGIKAGAFDYLTKPVELDHLVKKIHQAGEVERLEKEKKRSQAYQKQLEKKMIETERLAALGTLSTGIAHEINNPLAIISEAAGYMEQLLLSDKMETVPDKNCLLMGIDKIKKSIRRARKITLQLLGHVKQQESIPSLCDVKILLAETHDLLKKEFTDKRINVKWHMSSDDYVIFSDPYQIRQIFINILTNAVHAVSADGTVELDGTVDKDAVLITIKDNGTGIPKENMSKLFNPFFTTKPFDQGTGLGLFVVHKILESLNGSIDIKSDLGKGTRVTIRLPREMNRGINPI